MGAGALYREIIEGRKDTTLPVSSTVFVAQYGAIVSESSRWISGSGDDFQRIVREVGEFHGEGEVLEVLVNEFNRANPKEIYEKFGSDVVVAELLLERNYWVFMIFDENTRTLQAVLLDVYLI